MIELNFEERRILGVLMEKAYATPEQYPLTLNALVSGANQKSCRNPVSHLTEDVVLDALDSLREKELVTLVRTIGGRTDRYKHRAGETLQVEGKEAAVLAELLLRGPQTDGELRQRAARLQPIADVPELVSVLNGLREREPALARRLSPEGRRRGVKYAHTLYPPGEEPEEDPAEEVVHSATVGEPARAPSRAAASGAAVEELRGELEMLKDRVGELESTVARLLAGGQTASPDAARGEA